MFTGENTEILDYKVELNSAWFISLPIYAGQDRAANAEPGRAEPNKNQVKQDKQKPLVETIRDLRKEVKAEEDFQQNDDFGVSPSAQRELEANKERLSELEQKALLRTNVPLRTGQNAVDTEAHGLAQKRITVINDSQPPGTVTGRVTPSTTVIETDPETQKLRDDVNNRLANNNTQGSIFFAEDINDVSDKAKDRNRQNNQNKQVNNVSAQVSPTGSTKESNIEGTKDSNRSFFANSMNQVYGFKGQMINLDLEIKGDPYWLGEPNPRKRLTSSEGFPEVIRDHTKSDSLLLLTFKFPIAVDDGGDAGRIESYKGTGLYDLVRQENGFNGIYYVTKVENSFAGGRFTQRITGYIDPLTKEQDLLSELTKQDMDK